MAEPKWISRIDTASEGKFPCTRYFHIVHKASGNLLSVEVATGDTRDGARIVCYARGSGPIKTSPAIAEWRFEPIVWGNKIFHENYGGPGSNAEWTAGPLLLINRYSGLPLSGGANLNVFSIGVVQKIDPNIDYSNVDYVDGNSDPAIFTLRGIPKESATQPAVAIGVREHVSDYTYQYYLRLNQTAPGGRVEQVSLEKHGQRQDGYTHPVPDMNPHPETNPEDKKIVWLLEPTVATPYKTAGDKSGYKLDLSETESGYAYAHDALGMVSDVANTVGFVFGNAESLGVGGFLRLVDHVVGFLETSDQQHREDPLQVLYETMMPQIRNMIESELVQDNVTDAMSEAKAASIAWRTISGALKAIAEKVKNDGDQPPNGPTLLQMEVKKMSDDEAARFRDLLSQSDEHFRSALAVLMRGRNAEKGLSSFIPVAAEHTAVAVLLSLLYPDVDGKNLSGLLGAYESHLKGTWAKLQKERKAMIGADAKDSLTNVVMSSVEVAMHNAVRTLDLDLGQPSVAIRNYSDLLSPPKSS